MAEAEAAKRAAIAFYTPKLQSRPVRWALRFARRSMAGDARFARLHEILGTMVEELA